MRASLRPLAVLHADPALRRRLHRVAAGRFQLHTFQLWEEFERAIRDSTPSGIGIIDPYHGQPPREGIAPKLFSLLTRFPSATLIAAFSMRPGWLNDVRTLGERGIAGVIDLEVETTDLILLRTLETVRSRALSSLLQSELRLGTTGRGRAIVDASVQIATAGGQASDLARRMHMHRDTLLRWCRRAGLPPPRRLLLWMRLLLAAELLDNPGQTVERVALACGYSSDSALARAFAQYVGFRPRCLRERGAFHTVASRVAREIGEFRREGRGA